MSEAYDEYIQQHQRWVHSAFDYLLHNDIITEQQYNDYLPNMVNHDLTKYSDDEYKVYDQYFYGERTAKVEKQFDLAFLKHIHRNPHHWQYWILVNNEEDEAKQVVLEMEEKYIVEMICDWWSFSWANNDLRDIFSWYDGHKETILFAPKTREFVENLLNKIDSTLND